VERRLQGVSAVFLGCSEAEDCVRAIDRAVKLESTAADRALSDRLAQRLVDSGAVDVRMSLERIGDSLDVVVEYSAPVGSKAAIDTFIRPEWVGVGDKGSYRLVVDAQDSMGEVPAGVEIRRTPVDSNGTWKTAWVYGKRVRDVAYRMGVDEQVEPIFSRVPKLARQLERAGLLDTPEGSEVRIATSKSTKPTKPAKRPKEPVAAVPDQPEQAPPQTVGQMFIYAPRIQGALSEAIATTASRALEPGVRRCHQARLDAGVVPQGYAFADATVRADGWLLSYSVYGEVDDPVLISCMTSLMDDWSFPGWDGPDGSVAEVSVPFQFRGEAEPARKRRTR